MTITIRTGDVQQLEAFLVERIYEYNAAATGHDDGESFAAVRESSSGDIEAGISGYTWCGCCYIAYLWVAEAVRGRGIGRELLQAVEDHARAKACRVVFVATHSFQAPGFYGRNGFRADCIDTRPPRRSLEHFLRQALGGVGRSQCSRRFRKSALSRHATSAATGS